MSDHLDQSDPGVPWGLVLLLATASAAVLLVVMWM